MMTEDEARKKWCPFIRHYSAAFDPCGNSMAHDRDVWPFTCIASQCMAWRHEMQTVAFEEDRPSGRGYCGLAGKDDAQ